MKIRCLDCGHSEKVTLDQLVKITGCDRAVSCIYCDEISTGDCY